MRFETTQLDRALANAWYKRQLRPTGIMLEESAIVDGELYARLADDETITGQYTFTKNLVWKANGSFSGTQQHSNTANRVYTWPDKTGIVAFLDDVGSYAQPIVHALRSPVDQSDKPKDRSELELKLAALGSKPELEPSKASINEEILRAYALRGAFAGGFS